MTDSTDTSLRAAIERAYDENQQPRRAPLKPLRQEISRLQDRERFIALCQREYVEEARWKRNTAEAVAQGYEPMKPPRSVVKEWVEKYRVESGTAVSGAMAQFSTPLIYVSHVALLAQAQGELDLREETVRRLLGGGTFDYSVMRLRQRGVASKRRRDRLQEVIDAAVDKFPAITLSGLVALLRMNTGPGCLIDDMEGDTVSWETAGREIRDTNRAAIKKRLARAKKRRV